MIPHKVFYTAALEGEAAKILVRINSGELTNEESDSANLTLDAFDALKRAIRKGAKPWLNYASGMTRKEINAAVEFSKTN